MKPAEPLAAMLPAPAAASSLRAGIYRRHDLVWRADQGQSPELPWVVARRAPEDVLAGRLRLGRCVPSLQGKAERSAGMADESEVWMHRPPLATPEILATVPGLAPPWQQALRQLAWLGAAHGASVRVYGSLSWQALASARAPGAASYLHPASDLDVLVEPRQWPDRFALGALLEALWQLRIRLVAAGGPRLDGELRLPARGDLSWLELRAALAAPGQRVLVKDALTVQLLTPEGLLAPPEHAGPATAWLDACAVGALRLEAETWPKPGLVSPVDAGSHQDMDIRTLRAAIDALQGCFGECARVACHQGGFAELAAIGRAAEVAMLRATGGINAYRGAIFHLGLLAAASAVCPPGGAPQDWVARHWGPAILAHRVAATTHGAVVRARDGAGGALREAATGYPTVTRVLLPALRAARQRGFAPERARLAALLASIAVLEDSNLLWRGGRDGLDWARSEARRCLEEDLLAQPDWRARLAEVHHRFVARRLSPGGSADLLACACFLDQVRPE